MIDWNKPLEDINGVPLKLTDPKQVFFGLTNPDRDGDYWIEREDGQEFGYHFYKDVVSACVSPDGSGIVRNRAEPADLAQPDQFPLIRQWAEDRNLIAGSTPDKQMLKLVEEFGELGGAMARGKLDGAKDAIGDMIVVLTILSAQQGFTIEECIALAWDEIKDRRGRMIDGVFVKDGEA